ncbi:hypothetical protein [Parasutterella sp.]|uniref:hypothetical protein n=1 Tax=Parasutterella sp. TaxID=2049037 RepID=UPI003522DACB
MRDFEDFRDAVLNKISALEVSDDEKWEKTLQSINLLPSQVLLWTSRTKFRAPS